ncbi:hypothetical protein [Brachyspira hyodysenteriae]|nr:hypothetical protein [Brachyspira hyodysenteriae]MCZ9955010.1 hypothetical protein [Brachyspira hyodysenteriae]
MAWLGLAWLGLAWLGLAWLGLACGNKPIFNELKIIIIYLLYIII